MTSGFHRFALPMVALSLTSFSCQVNPVTSVHDLAAIHDPTTWQPVDNPEVTSRYQISDHQQLEELMLTNMGAVAPGQFSHAFELSSWALVMLMHDDNPGARRKSVALLGTLAGGWISQYGAIAYPDGSASIESAIGQLAAASDGPALEAAALALLNSPTPDVYGAIRILAAYGRIIHNVPVAETRHQVISSLALRLVMVGLYAATLDADEDVSESATITTALLESNLFEN